MSFAETSSLWVFTRLNSLEVFPEILEIKSGLVDLGTMVAPAKSLAVRVGQGGLFQNKNKEMLPHTKITWQEGLAGAGATAGLLVYKKHHT